MKTIKALIIVAFLFGICPPSVRAGDDDFNRLVVKWIGQRDALVVNIVRSWLRGASAKSLQPDIIELVNIESRLAVNGDVPLYMNSFTDARDPEKTLADLVRSYLRRRGIEFQTKDFLVGKEFKVLREEVRATDPDLPASGNKFQFQSWGKSPKASPAKNTK